MNITRTLAVALSAVTLASTSLAVLVVDRGLPTANLNNVSGANRSNVAWGDPQNPEQYIIGDDFSMPNPGSSADTWTITKVTTWAVAGAAGDANFFMGDRYQNVRLYMGLPGIGLVTSGSFIAGTNTVQNFDGVTITVTRDQYVGGLDYETTSGAFAQLWKVEFSGLNFVVNAGDTVNLGVSGTAYDQVNRTWFNHSSNAGLSGSTQDGSDNLMREFDLANLPDPGVAWDSNQAGIWDKSSDMNMMIEADYQAVPEPATMAIVGAGVAALLRTRRSK